MNQHILDTIQHRRSTRKYRAEQIQETALQAILEAGNWAPSACNDQSWHFTVIQHRETIDHINAVAKKAMTRHTLDWVVQLGQTPEYHIFYGAPTVVVVSGREDAMAPMVDCAAATQNMLLAAEGLGVGSCWIGLARGFFASEEDVRQLPIPSGYKPFYAVCFGYRDGDSAPGPARKAPAVSYIR